MADMERGRLSPADLSHDALYQEQLIVMQKILEQLQILNQYMAMGFDEKITGADADVHS